MSLLRESHKSVNGCFLPRLPTKAIHGAFASVEGASEENWSLNRTWSKSFTIAVKLRAFQNLSQWGDFLQRLSPKIIHAFASAEGASEDRFQCRKQNLIKKFQTVVQFCAFQDCVNHAGVRMFVLCQAFHQKYLTVLSRAPKARAKKIRNLDTSTLA